MSAPSKSRKSASERREEIVDIALEHFAAGGYRGTSTEAIARDAGISQPYLFRLFGTKRDLFLACSQACHDAVYETFRRAAEGVEREGRFAAMGAAYGQLLEDRRLLRFQLQSYAASSDPEIQAKVRAGYMDLVALVRRLTGGTPEEVWAFFARGMLLNVAASLDLTLDD